MAFHPYGCRLFSQHSIDVAFNFVRLIYCDKKKISFFKPPSHTLWLPWTLNKFSFLKSKKLIVSSIFFILQKKIELAGKSLNFKVLICMYVVGKSWHISLHLVNSLKKKMKRIKLYQKKNIGKILKITWWLLNIATFELTKELRTSKA